MTYDDYEDFKNYVMYCVDAEDFPPESYSCGDVCKSCKYFELFGEQCPCALNISCTGYDDKGNKIVVSCNSYEQTNKKGGNAR